MSAALALMITDGQDTQKRTDFAMTHGCARCEAAIRQLEFDARAHDDGAFAGKPEVFGGVSGDS